MCVMWYRPGVGGICVSRGTDQGAGGICVSHGTDQEGVVSVCHVVQTRNMCVMRYRPVVVVYVCHVVQTGGIGLSVCHMVQTRRG